uniref:Uncharacterized protein n=1 Tax=Plectus sambesii TaxID=2011161 RepID=A0A914X6Z9_9BILA
MFARRESHGLAARGRDKYGGGAPPSLGGVNHPSRHPQQRQFLRRRGAAETGGLSSRALPYPTPAWSTRSGRLRFFARPMGAGDWEKAGGNRWIYGLPPSPAAAQAPLPGNSSLKRLPSHSSAEAMNLTMTSVPVPSLSRNPPHGQSHFFCFL